MVLAHRTPARAAAALQRYSAGGMKSAFRILLGLLGSAGGKSHGEDFLAAWVASEPMPVTALPDGASALIW